MNRYLTLKATTGDVRTEEYLGRTWTVVPIVALVEGVMQAMNAATPELVTADVYSKLPEGWNGRPLFIGHPLDSKGSPVAGNTPAVLEALAIGQVFAAKVTKNKLAMEAWIDNDRAPLVPGGENLLERIAAGEPIEISVGAYVETIEEEGEWAGKAYGAKWVDLMPEHLALLVEGDIGACSRAAGCGVRAAKGVTVNKQIDKTNGNIFSRIMAAFRTAQPAADMSDNDVRNKLGEAIRAVDPRSAWPEAVYDDVVVYCVYNSDYSGVEYYQRPYTLAADGTVTLGDPSEVEPVLSYELVTAVGTAVTEPVAAVAAAVPAVKAAGCKCGGHEEVVAEPIIIAEEKNMKTEEIVVKLATATSEQLEAIGKVFAPVAEPAIVPAVVVEPVKVASTFAEVIALASPEVKAEVAAIEAAVATKKTTTIAALKASGRCAFTDAELAAKSQTELETLAKLADVKVAVDFSGRGTVKDQSSSAGDVPAAPDLLVAIRAAQGQK